MNGLSTRMDSLPGVMWHYSDAWSVIRPPRLNLGRYHDVLVPHAAGRAQIVPGPKPAHDATDAGGSEGETTPAQRRHRLAWAVLLARVFQFELTVWDRCGGASQDRSCRHRSGVHP